MCLSWPLGEGRVHQRPLQLYALVIAGPRNDAEMKLVPFCTQVHPDSRAPPRGPTPGPLVQRQSILPKLRCQLMPVTSCSPPPSLLVSPGHLAKIPVMNRPGSSKLSQTLVSWVLTHTAQRATSNPLPAHCLPAVPHLPMLTCSHAVDAPSSKVGKHGAGCQCHGYFRTKQQWLGLMLGTRNFFLVSCVGSRAQGLGPGAAGTPIGTYMECRHCRQRLHLQHHCVVPAFTALLLY